MNLLADENVDASIVSFLRSEGHDVLWIMEAGRGSQDMDILQTAASQKRVVLTFDRDFGELVFRQQSAAHGIVLLRLNPPSPGALLAAFRLAWAAVHNRVAGSFVVISETKIRIRPLPPISG